MVPQDHELDPAESCLHVRMLRNGSWGPWRLGPEYVAIIGQSSGYNKEKLSHCHIIHHLGGDLLIVIRYPNANN